MYKRQELKGQALARSYGRYENVFLTDTELSELQAELPEKWAYYIERLSGYIASTGKKYKNHAATITDGRQTIPQRLPRNRAYPNIPARRARAYEQSVYGTSFEYGG